MVRLLRESEVEDLVDLQGAIACMERTYRQQAENQITASPPSTLRSDDAMMMVRAGGLAGDHQLGFRISRARGRAIALVFDTPVGDLQALVGYPFSDLRVSATMALAVDRLAAAGSTKLGMIGTGGIAWASISGISAIRGLKEVNVYSRGEDHRQEFAGRVEKELEIAASPRESAQEAIEGADIVVVATSASAPVLQAEWLPEGALVAGAGNRPELGPDVYRRASFIVTTSKVHETNVGEWPLTQLVKAGEIKWEDVAELGEVVAGKKQRPAGLTVFREAQGGFSDIALAALALERATAAGRGSEWDLEEAGTGRDARRG